MERQDKYHPSLFERNNDHLIVEEENPFVIPQNTLYDAPIQTQHIPMRRHVTVFGFSQQNRVNILEQIERCVKVYRKEEGKNWINIWNDDISSLDALLKLNHKIINGELIGVYRKSFGVVEDPDIYIKKKGILKKVYEYFLGQ
jgi:hypothetical protein